MHVDFSFHLYGTKRPKLVWLVHLAKLLEDMGWSTGVEKPVWCVDSTLTEPQPH